MISIIVPIYNTENSIERCIDSLVNQVKTQNEYEIILVNDGSTDNSLSICKKYADQFKNIHIIDKVNEGVSMARKAGLDEAKGSYVIFVDADDWLELDCLSKVEQKLEEFAPDVLAFDYYLVNGNNKSERHFELEGIFEKKKLVEKVFPYLISDKKGCEYRHAIWGSVYKKDLLSKYMLIDRRAQIDEDGAITISVLYNSERVYYLPVCLYNYYLGDCSVTRSRKVYNKDGPLVVGEFVEKNINVNKYDFKQQLNRRITHDVYNVCCSVFNGKGLYYSKRSKVKKILDNTYYEEAINGSRFDSLYYSFAKFSMKYKLFFMMYIVNYIKSIVLKRLY